MSPERKCKIGNDIIKEYYWGGKLVVYVNNRAVDKSYEEACRHSSKELEEA